MNSSQTTTTLEPEQLQTLLEKFFKKCGSEKDGFMTREIFADFIETDTKFFNDRLFQMIDKDQTGKISFNDFRTFVERYSGKSYEEKLDFLFNLYDINGDKTLDKKELKEMLKSNMLENGVKLDDSDVDLLISTLLEEALGEEESNLTNASLTQEDLHNLFQSHVELIENLSTIIEKWLQPVSAHQDQRKKAKNPIGLERAKKWTENNQVFLFWLLAYIFTNIFLFITRILIFIFNFSGNDTIYLAIARGCGWCLDFNGCFILLAMMRHTLTRLRSTWFNHILPIDDHRLFHELCGKLIAAFSLLHMIMHLLHVNVALKNNSPWSYSSYLFNLKATPSLGLIPGFAYISGFVLIFILTVMVLGTLPIFRHNGSVFYISHRACYPIFFIFLILHCKDFWKWFVAPGILFLIEQIFRTYCNWFGYKTFVETGITLSSRVTNLVLKRPNGFNFSPGDYIFINIPEFGWSEWHPFTISSAPENWDEITLHISAKGAWTTQLYDYFNRINTTKRRRLMSISRPIPVPGTAISEQAASNENLRRRLSSNHHYSYLRKLPMSVRLPPIDAERSAPELPSLSFRLTSHKKPDVKVVASPDSPATTYDKPLRVYIDGPYGTPSREIFLAEHAVLIGGGIGVTPFASILQSIMYRHLETKLCCPGCDHKFSRGFEGQMNRLKKVDFYWINREQNAFEWFTNLLSKLEIEQKELDGQLERFLDIHMYMTKALRRSDMRAVALQLAFDLQYAKTERDLLAGLKARMRAGRPKWKEIFKTLNDEKKGNVVVFFCGPAQMGSELNALCNQYGFIFKTEKF